MRGSGAVTSGSLENLHFATPCHVILHPSLHDSTVLELMKKGSSLKGITISITIIVMYQGFFTFWPTKI